jgi:hypothetical protein
MAFESSLGEQKKEDFTRIYSFLRLLTSLPIQHARVLPIKLAAGLNVLGF